jgi:hypothetical protein
MAADWFEDLTGFRELSYEKTRENLEVVGQTLRSRINNRSYLIGELEVPSLLELRNRAQQCVGPLAGTLEVSNVSGDVRSMHRQPANRNAMFQVASQFNLLEMAGPHISPEDGVTRYIDDRTQGPACAIATGAATLYRNYFVPVDGRAGQTRDRQIDCLKDLGDALGNGRNALWTMRNGYALCTEEGLATIARKLDALDARGTDALRDRLRVGIHSGVQVTDSADGEPVVSQVFCSALPVTYTNIPAGRWKSFAALILEGAYEATVWAAVINAHRFSSNILFLTQVGGGAFGNDSRWIYDAIRRALKKVARVGLDVRLVSYGQPDPRLERLARELTARVSLRRKQ